MVLVGVVAGVDDVRGDRGEHSVRGDGGGRVQAGAMVQGEKDAG